MMWCNLVIILFAWHTIAMFFLIFCVDSAPGTGALSKAEGFEYVNPCFIHKHNKVNWFGAVVVCVVYSLVFPIGTLGYWVYKLCTVGRK